MYGGVKVFRVTFLKQAVEKLLRQAICCASSPIYLLMCDMFRSLCSVRLASGYPYLRFSAAC